MPGLIRDRLPITGASPKDAALKQFAGDGGLTTYELWKDVTRPEQLHQQMEWVRTRLAETAAISADLSRKIQNQTRAAQYVSAATSTAVPDIIDYSASNVVVDAFDGSIRPAMRHMRTVATDIQVIGSEGIRDSGVLVGRGTGITVHPTEANYVGFYLSGPKSFQVLGRTHHGPGVSLDMGDEPIEITFDESEFMIWGVLSAVATYPPLATIQTRQISSSIRVPNGLILPEGVEWLTSTDGSTWGRSLGLADTDGSPFVKTFGEDYASVTIAVGDTAATAYPNSGVQRTLDGKIDVPYWVIPETVVVYKDLNRFLISEVNVGGSFLEYRSRDKAYGIEVSGDVFGGATLQRHANRDELLEDEGYQRILYRIIDRQSAIDRLEALLAAQVGQAEAVMAVEGASRDFVLGRAFRKTGMTYRTFTYPWNTEFVVLPRQGTISHRPANIERAKEGVHLPQSSFYFPLDTPQPNESLTQPSRATWDGWDHEERKAHYEAIAVHCFARWSFHLGSRDRNAELIDNPEATATGELIHDIQTGDMVDLQTELAAYATGTTFDIRSPMTADIFDRMLLGTRAADYQEVLASILEAFDGVAAKPSEDSLEEFIRFMNGQALLHQGDEDGFSAALEALTAHFRAHGALQHHPSHKSFVGGSVGRVSTYIYAASDTEITIAIPNEYFLPNDWIESQGSVWRQVWLNGVPITATGKTDAQWRFILPLRDGKNSFFFHSSMSATREIAELDITIWKGGVGYGLSMEDPSYIITPHPRSKVVDYDVYEHYVKDDVLDDVVGLKNKYDYDASAWTSEIWVQRPEGVPSDETWMHLQYKYRDETPETIMATDESFYLRGALVSEKYHPHRIPALTIGYRL